MLIWKDYIRQDCVFYFCCILYERIVFNRICVLIVLFNQLVYVLVDFD